MAKLGEIKLDVKLEFPAGKGWRYWLARYVAILLEKLIGEYTVIVCEKDDA